MSKKPTKPAKAKQKPAPKKAAKPVKAAPAKKAAPKAVAKKAAPKKATPPKKPVVKTKPEPKAKPELKAKAEAKTKPEKAAATPAKGLLKVVGKAIAQAIAPKKAATPTAAPVKAAKPQAAPKPAKVEAKAPKEAPPEEAEVDTDNDEEAEGDEEVVLTDAEGRRYCRVKDCDQLSAVDGYCRYHYLALWKKIQVRKKILSEGKLERYIEELTARYPDKFLEMLRKDLRSEKEFLAAIQELEIDENAVDNEFEDEAQNYIDEVRGIEPSAREEEDF